MSEEVSPLILKHVLANKPALLIRDFLLDIFTETEKTKATIVSEGEVLPETDSYIYTGKLLDVKGYLYSVIKADGIKRNAGTQVSAVPTGIPTTSRLWYRNSKIVTKPGQLVNYNGTEDLHTTSGRLLLSQVILVEPFGSLIPFINGKWDIGAVEEIIFEGLRDGTITVEQVKCYSRCLHWLGHFTELGVPGFTERSLTVDPKIIARRDELIKEHKEAIEVGDSNVMKQIESELVAMDRASLKGDVSTLFYDADNKSYEVHRKMMFIFGGMIPKFGDSGFSLIDSSLEEGWKIKDFPTIGNEIRRGSFARAKQTAKGGEESKFIIRVFQNTRIIDDNCGSTDYLNVTLTKDISSKFMFRSILVDGQLIVLDKGNISSYIGKTVQMRSPMFCHSNPGYCYTCSGELFRTINQELLTMVGIAIGSSFTKAALKSKHFSVARAISISSLNKFCI